MGKLPRRPELQLLVLLWVGAVATTAACAGASEFEINGTEVETRGSIAFPPEASAFIKAGNAALEARVRLTSDWLDFDARATDLNGREMFNSFSREGNG